MFFVSFSVGWLTALVYDLSRSSTSLLGKKVKEVEKGLDMKLVCLPLCSWSLTLSEVNISSLGIEVSGEKR